MSQTTRMRDEDIINLYFSRNEQAIRETERNWGRACMGVSMDILGSRPDAEECVNDTYLKVWNSIPPARPQSLGAYVLRIVRNLSISRLRTLTAEKRDRGATVPLSELGECLPAAGNTAQTYTEGELTAALDRFLDTLDDLDRRLFVGRYWYNLPVRTLADEWGLRPNAVTKRLGRIREKLRHDLEKGGFTV